MHEPVRARRGRDGRIAGGRGVLAPSTGLTGLTGLVAARLAAKAGVPRAEPAVMPRLAPGKPVPGPAAWRALERHASSFRLR